jgi:hypothetical protein
MKPENNERKKLIKEYSYLLWYVPENAKEKINNEVLVEMILTNGDWRAVQRLIEVLGIRKVSEIFFNQISRPRNNYRKQTRHFFTLYFNMHVKKRNTDRRTNKASSSGS